MAPFRLTLVALDRNREPPRALAEELERILGATITTTESSFTLLDVYDPSRRQYHAGRILDLLESVEGDRVLGLTSEDLFIPIFTFVFGLARLGGRTAVVSTARLDHLAGAPDDAAIESRLVKEAVHELGHTLGLEHCVDPSCVMASSRDAEEVDLKGATFCPRCERRAAGGARIS